MTNLQPKYGKSFALVIGIDRFIAAPPLTTAVYGASAISALLHDRYQFDEISTLYNEQATKAAIEDAYSDLRAKMQPDDRFVIYWAGHGIGIQGNVRSEGWLLAYDSVVTPSRRLIRMKDLADPNLTPAKHAFVILDTCHSGYAVTYDTPRAVEPETEQHIAVQSFLRRRAYKVLASANPLETATDAGLVDGHTPFTGYLLKSLTGIEDARHPVSRLLTSSSVALYVQDRVASFKGNWQGPQLGTLPGDEGGMLVWEIPFTKMATTLEALPERLRRALSSSDSEKRYLALSEVENLLKNGQYVTELRDVLLELAPNDPDRDVRTRATALLLKLGQSISEPPISEAIHFVNPKVEETIESTTSTTEIEDPTENISVSSSVTTRPAIVIGLGGTGEWILTFLKKELLEKGYGILPRGIRLLAFDTNAFVSAQIGTSQQKKGKIEFGSAQMTPGSEYIPFVAQRLDQLAQEIAEGKHENLNWFPAQALMSKLGHLTTTQGAGSVRHLGRLSLFSDVQQVSRSALLSNLHAAILALQNDIADTHQLEILVVSSLAGGTGAGTLIDVPLLLREQARLLGLRNFTIRGLFVLPSAFSRGQLGGEWRRMYANAFATWRELDRFMIAGNEFGTPQIAYHSSNKDLQVRATVPPYDVTYLIDPNRQQYSLAVMPPTEGLYPAIANYISNILDDVAGPTQTEFTNVNLKAERLDLPRRPYHSAVGTYSMKVPAYHSYLNFTHNLGKDLLQEILAPVVDSKTGHAIRVSSTGNLEVNQNEIGLQAAVNFMFSSGFHLDGQQIPNTQLLPLIAQTRVTDAAQDSRVIDTVAKGSMTGINGGQRNVLDAFTGIGQDDEGKSVLQDISHELEFQISQARGCGLSRDEGDTPAEAVVRLQKHIAEERAKHYGVASRDGSELQGEFWSALDKARQIQVTRFQRMLRTWLLVSLNGTSPNVMVARAGKIGWIASVLDGISETLQYFRKYIEAVRRYRSDTLRVLDLTKQRRDKAWADYQQLSNKKFAFNFTAPEAHRSQREYLIAEQQDIDAYKDELLLKMLITVADDLVQVTERARNEVESWIRVLAVGDPDDTNLPGLYNVLTDSLNNISIIQAHDENLELVTTTVGKRIYDTDTEHLREAIERIVWHVYENHEGELGINCGVYLGGNEINGPEFFAFQRPNSQLLHSKTADATIVNLELLLQLAAYRYEDSIYDQNIAQELMLKFPDPRSLADYVRSLAEPLYRPSSISTGPRKVTAFINLHSPTDSSDKYFDEFKDAFCARMSHITDVRVVESDDPFKMTIIRTDDLMPSEDFSQWEQCKDAYIQLVTNSDIPGSELHVFPAEINACVYETLFPQILRKAYRILQPEVVALLENRERFEIFFRLLALDYIRYYPADESPNSSSAWIYEIPGMKEPLYLTNSLPNHSGGRQEESLFQVIGNFVNEGIDRREGYNFLRIEYENARQAIVNRQQELGNEESKVVYDRTITNGIVSALRGEVQVQRNGEQNPARRHLILREYEDLADVAEIVYRRAIHALG